MASPLIDLPQMIDLACGSPESGVINFNALHALLHVIVQQMRLEASRVEYMGSENDAINRAIRAVASRPLFDLTEFSVKSDVGDASYPKRVKREPPTNPSVKTIIVVRKNSQRSVVGKSTSSSPTAGQQTTDGFPLQPMDVPTNEDFRELVENDFDIDDPIAPVLPKSSQLLSSLNGEPGAVTDMWNMLNVTKRLDAAELTIQKLIGMLGEMGKEYSRVNSLVMENSRTDQLTEIKDQLDTIEHKIHRDSSRLDSLSPIQEFIAVGQTKDEVKELSKQSPVKESVKGPGKVEPKIIAPSAALADAAKLHNKDEIDTLKSDLDYMKMAVQRIAMCSGQKDIANYLTKDIKNMPCPGNPEGRSSIDHSQAKFKDDDEDANMMAMEKKFEMLERRLLTSDKRVYDLEKEFGDINDRIEDVLQTVERATNQDQETATLFAQLNELKAKSVSNNERLTNLSIARDTILASLDDIMNRIKRLDEVKIDREEVDEMLAEKADFNLVQRKVSTDHFDATKRELGNGLLDTMNKLAEQEDTLKEQLDGLRNELTGKITQDDLANLREMFLSKMQIMQDRMKAITASRREPEAAATKTKFLRDVQCLSCEQKVVMRKEEPATVMKADPMVAMKSMKPQLTYDLDNIRRELNQTGTSRNMHHFELMYRGASRSGLDNTHPCNRYCGGSHTAISPMENFEKRHFNKPRGCSVIKPANLIKGTDGTFYKGAPFEPCRCGDTPFAEVAATMAAANPAPTEHEAKPEIVIPMPVADTPRAPSTRISFPVVETPRSGSTHLSLLDADNDIPRPASTRVSLQVADVSRPASRISLPTANASKPASTRVSIQMADVSKPASRVSQLVPNAPKPPSLQIAEDILKPTSRASLLAANAPKPASLQMDDVSKPTSRASLLAANDPKPASLQMAAVSKPTSRASLLAANAPKLASLQVTDELKPASHVSLPAAPAPRPDSMRMSRVSILLPPDAIETEIDLPNDELMTQ